MDGFAATLATFEDEPELEFDKDSPEIEGTYLSFLLIRKFF